MPVEVKKTDISVRLRWAAPSSQGVLPSGTVGGNGPTVVMQSPAGGGGGGGGGGCGGGGRRLGCGFLLFWPLCRQPQDDNPFTIRGMQCRSTSDSRASLQAST